LKNFASSPRGTQLDFLLHSERSHYKLTEWPSDLTPLQILFLITCAENYKAELDKMQSQNTTKTSPLSITKNDSPEEIKRKVQLMKELYGK
jgi:hypothetical protein